ncbi:hypothetical protein AC249_AIPGENE22209 [Exaiptasia diaphana]|nr:hypothetical protein AC249_AIPGENE22209 [Exaiptasia diaphana]
MTASDLVNCVTECGKTKGCLSINSHNAGNVIHCELNKSNRYGRQANLVKTSFGHEYLEMPRLDPVGHRWPPHFQISSLVAINLFKD